MTLVDRSALSVARSAQLGGRGQDRLERRRAEGPRAVRIEAVFRVGVVRGVLVGHLDGEREAAKRFADPVTRGAEVAAAGLVARVAVFVLEVVVALEERVLEQVLEVANAIVVRRVALTAGEKAPRVLLVAVHIEKEVDAG